MAVATTTALAIGSIAVSAASAGVSFAQANKQKKAMQNAEADAAEAMSAARGKLEVNFAEQMSIKKEAYDLEREAMLVQGAQITTAATEGDQRGVGAVAGRVYAGQQQGQAGVRTAMADELTNIEGAILEEDSRLRDLDVALDLEEVAGNQQAAADAQRAATAAKQQAIQQTISTVGTGLSQAGLYAKNTSAQKAAVGGMQFTPDQYDKFGNAKKGMGPSSKGFSNLDFGAVGGMSNRKFRQFERNLTPEQQSMMFLNDDYISNYQNQLQASNQYFGYNP